MKVSFVNTKVKNDCEPHSTNTWSVKDCMKDCLVLLKAVTHQIQSERYDFFLLPICTSFEMVILCGNCKALRVLNLSSENGVVERGICIIITMMMMLIQLPMTMLLNVC